MTVSSATSTSSAATTASSSSTSSSTSSGGSTSLSSIDWNALVEAGVQAAAAGCTIIGTTLAGYSGERPKTDGPDFALVEEIGEVAACLTYDNDAETGHNSDLESEVIQVIALALAWATRYLDDGRE